VKTTFLKWMAVVAGAGLATAVIHPRLARSADHLDAPATTAEPAADINDVYTFMDGTNAVFAMTTFPAAPTTAAFSNTVQYVIHTSSGAAFGKTNTDFNIICEFDTTGKASCWGGTTEFVTGDATAVTGLKSASGKFTVFAGRRADPFFFNLDGFKATVKDVDNAAPALIDAGTCVGVQNGCFNANGCPQLGTTTAAILATQLAKNPDGGGDPVDFFANLNGMAIVVSVDKSLINVGGPIVSVWGSTHRKP
jgi:hypothetical protein